MVKSANRNRKGDEEKVEEEKADTKGHGLDDLRFKYCFIILRF